MAVVELLAAADPPSAEEFKHLNLSDCCYLVATTKDDCHFELADFISSMVVQFLGVRASLPSVPRANRTVRLW